MIPVKTRHVILVGNLESRWSLDTSFLNPENVFFRFKKDIGKPGQQRETSKLQTLEKLVWDFGFGSEENVMRWDDNG